MKFAKGILSENEESQSGINTSEPLPTTVLFETQQAPIVVEKNRLFETIEKEKTSERSYAALLGIVCLVVLAGVGLAYYLMMPGVGDRIDPPRGLEAAIREHFLTNEKRTATDIAFYECENFVWSRVGVETRKDIPNPLLKIPSYLARATASGETWTITAVPTDSADLDVPCK